MLFNTNKMLISVLSLLVIAVFLIGCVPQEELSQENQQALESELEQMTDEQLDLVIKEGESEDTKALAGQAYSGVIVGKNSVKPSTALKTAYKVKAGRCELPDIDLESLIFLKSLSLDESLVVGSKSSSSVEYLSSMYCAEHFVKIGANQIPFCGNLELIGAVDSYGCGERPNYPPVNSCPDGMQMRIMSGMMLFLAPDDLPRYMCSVPQERGSRSAPAGCPISPADVECASGFIFDATSNLGWYGERSDMGCAFVCKAIPPSSENWPCLKEGYIRVASFRDGNTCCAKQ